MLRCLACLLLSGLYLSGCYDVLTHQDAETVWMDWTGTVEVAPASLQLSAATGQSIAGELAFTETSGEAGAEMALSLGGDAAGQLAIEPGEFTVAVTPRGSLPITVTYTAPAEVGSSTAELVVTSSGTPAEFRIPIDVTATAP